ncbi:hypothetical protein SLS62_005730 [Diatrype stigma]|uniref:Heterokaryon incompatibility domain-containing protein n=1 Tax=Diatrype stigma TaxID=117547 RepID=A0AAN9USA3_9PEZI
MLCDVCLQGLEGIWDPSKSKRLGTTAEVFGASESTFDRANLPSTIRVERNERVTAQKLDPELYVFGHHVDLESFRRSIRRGCVICNRFHLLAEGVNVEENPKLISLGYFSVFTVSLTTSKRLMTVRYGDVIGGFEIEPCTGDESLNFALAKFTGDETTWEMVNGWLTGCDNAHKSCLSNQRSSHFVPTRLLELQKTGGPNENENKFRLVSGTTVGPDERYATLSHHKGPHDVQPNTTTVLSKKTEASLQSGSLLVTLPKTFRDAFEVISRLGLRYIWIDSLCIYEDAPEDRSAEIAVMNEVYRNGFLNIAALGAGDDDAGCFFDRDPREVAPTIFGLQCRDAAGAKPEPHIFNLERRWSWRLTLDSEPLVRRAWFLQERLLAPRTLMFGRKQVFWECSEAISCELHPDWAVSSDRMAASSSMQSRPQHHFKTLIGGVYRTPSADPQRQLLLDWYSIVQDYAGLDLGVPGDKLVAISAIAKEARAQFARLGAPSSEYLAGIWKHSLPEGLLWNLRDSGRRPSSYRAPSWSWASVDGRLNIQQTWEGESAVWLASIVDASVTPVGDDDTAEVRGGSVVLKGPLPIAEVSKPGKEYLVRPEDRRIDLLRSSQGPGANVVLSKEDVGQDDKYKMDWSVLFDTADDVVECFSCLPIRAQGSHGRWWVSGLALTRKEDSPNVYRRAGNATFYVPDEQSARRLFEQFPEKIVEVQ